jgi:hypothetical protein
VDRLHFGVTGMYRGSYLPRYIVTQAQLQTLEAFMASSNERERSLARKKHERQISRREEEERKARRQKIIASVLIIGMILLTTGGFLIGQILS